VALYGNTVADAVEIRQEDLTRRSPRGSGEVYWSSVGRNDVLRVGNLSLGGMFVETRKPQPVGVMAQIHFLVEEGQIRIKAIVRHVKDSAGMGLQFIAVAHEDRPRLAALLTRLRSLSQSRHNQPS